MDPDAWASAHLRRANPFAWAALRVLCTPAGFVAFTRVYGYFRWADDVVDAPRRDRAAVLAFVARQRTLLDGAAPTEPAEHALARALVATPGLRAPVERMWAALAFDAARDASPLADADLDAQVARIGDSYLAALWTCSGADGEPPAGLAALSRAATLAHVLRDVELDRGLGYVNVPAGEDEADWRARRAAEAEALFDAGAAVLATLPFGRTRALVGLFAWRYRRLLRALQPRRMSQPTRR